MSQDWQQSLSRDPEYYWWIGWVAVPALAELRIASDQELGIQMPTEDAADEDPELDSMVDEAESMMEQFFDAFADPDALASLVKARNPKLNLDAPMEGGDGRSQRDMLKLAAENLRKELENEDDDLDEEEREIEANDERDAESERRRAAGELEVMIDVVEEDDADEEPSKTRDPLGAQIAAIEDFRRHHAERIRAILTAIAIYANGNRDTYSEGFAFFGNESDFDKVMPKNMTADQAAQRVEFHSISAERRMRDSIAFIRLEGSCSWDDEHGIGVTLLGDQVIGVGMASEPLWEDDAGA